MACHTVNMPFRALGFGYPTEIEAQTFGVMNNESYPIGSKIRFEFPARKFTVPAVNPSLQHKEDSIDQVATTFWWYDAGQPKEGASAAAMTAATSRRRNSPPTTAKRCSGKFWGAAAC